MNRYFTETITVPAQGTRRNAVLLALTQGMIVCVGAGGCAAVLDSRLSIAALGAAGMLLGTLLILSGKRALTLVLGTLTVLASGCVGAWSLYRLLRNQPLGGIMDERLFTAAMQLGILAAGLYFVIQPIYRIERAARICTRKVAARCISGIPEQDCIVWRYRVDEMVYDFEEKRCVSFLLPQMGDTCILRVDPKAPDRAVRIDRPMTAAQLLIGAMLIVEAAAVMVTG